MELYASEAKPFSTFVLAQGWDSPVEEALEAWFSTVKPLNFGPQEMAVWIRQHLNSCSSNMYLETRALSASYATGCCGWAIRRGLVAAHTAARMDPRRRCAMTASAPSRRSRCPGRAGAARGRRRCGSDRRGRRIRCAINPCARRRFDHYRSCSRMRGVRFNGDAISRATPRIGSIERQGVPSLAQAGQDGAGCMRQPAQRFRQFGDRRPFGCSKHLDRLRQLRPDPRRARARERLNVGAANAPAAVRPG